MDEGSFTAAARRLGVTKSYASKLVSRLEDRLGIRLLHRTTRRLSLTEPGRGYYERCTEAIQTLEEAETEATWLQNAPRGRLRVTLPTAFGVTYLTQPLAEFKARYPDLVIEAVFSDRHVDILEEGFDLAIRAGDLPDTSLIAQRLASADRVLCASEAYLERRGVPQKPEDLARHECLLYAYHLAPGTWNLRGPGEKKIAVEVSGTLVANHAQMLVEAACLGQGSSSCPCSIRRLTCGTGGYAACFRRGGSPRRSTLCTPRRVTSRPRCAPSWISWWSGSANRHGQPETRSGSARRRLTSTALCRCQGH